MDNSFHTFGMAHGIAVLCIIVMGVIALRFFRSDIPDSRKQRVANLFAGLLILAVALDPILTFYHYGFTQKGWALFWESALPLHLCDVVSILAAMALITRNVYLAEITYLWAITGTTQGLLTPTLQYGPRSVDFYSFFLQHGGVPIAAICLIWGLKIYPKKGAFKRAVSWTWLYMIIVFGINLLLKQNYGFLNHKPKVATMFDYMGSYPYYLITLQILAFSFYAILLAIAPKADAESSPV